MVKLAIRDDDMNFFTRKEDLELIYEEFNGFPISYAIIPEVLDVSLKGSCSDTKGNNIPKNIGLNKDLCDWIKAKYHDGHCDILLHGITHSYYINNGVRKAEMQWRENDTELSFKLKQKLDMFENLFEYRPTVFVAPSNVITKKCLMAVVKNELDFSGIVPISFQREITFRNIYSYLKRIVFRMYYRLPYPGVLIYSGHKEINACALNTYEYLVKMYSICESKNLPMVINVHYWHLRDNPDYLEMLRSFVMDYAIPRGAVPTKLTDILK